MGKRLGAPAIDLDAAELADVLEWVEIVKYRALVRECDELTELGLRVYVLSDGDSTPTWDAGFMGLVRNADTGERFTYEPYGSRWASQFANRKPGDKWRHRKPPGKPATEVEYLGTYRKLGTALTEAGETVTFIAEDIDLNSIVPTSEERTALAESTGVNGE